MSQTRSLQTRSPLTRNDLVRHEGRDARDRQRSRKDNPYRPGSADWCAWSEGFGN